MLVVEDVGLLQVVLVVVGGRHVQHFDARSEVPDQRQSRVGYLNFKASSEGLKTLAATGPTTK